MDALLGESGDSGVGTVDLIVAVSGADYQITRSYTSNPDYAGAGLVGEGWQSSPFLFMEFVADGGHGKLRFSDATMREFEFASSDGSKWSAGGPTAQHIEQSTATIGANTYATWRLVVPGFRTIDFYRAHAGGGGITATPATHEGLLLVERDVYGNEQRYDYTIYGDRLIPPASAARLARVTLTSGHSTPIKQAEVDFEWIGDDSLPNAGRLSRVRVFRSDDNWSTRTETQRAEYRYKSDGDGLPAPLGVGGDLLEVRRFTRLDDSSDADLDTWWQRVRQYRYHGGVASESTDTDGDGFIEKGGAHQLKMIFEPEQVEFFAQSHSQSSGSTVESVADGAAILLTLDDEDYWHAGATGIAADVAAEVYDQYELTGERRLVQMQIQSDCGCGGGSAQTLLRNYTYKSFNPTPSFGDITDAVQIATSHFDGSWIVDHVDYHHYAYVGGPRPYLTTHATTSAGKEWVTHLEYENSDRRVVTRVMTPEAVGAFVDGFGASAPSYTASATTGLVYGYDYLAGTPYRTKAKRRQGNDANLANFSNWVEYERSVSGKPHLRSARKLYRHPTSIAADDVATVTYSYGFYSGSDAVAWRETTAEAETVAENGPGGTYSGVALFNAAGAAEWIKSADGSLTKQAFDAGSAVVTSRTANAAYDAALASWPGSPAVTGWGHNGSEDEMRTDLTVDLLGRVTSGTRLANTTLATTSYTRREMQGVPSAMTDSSGSPARQGIPYYATVQLPHVIAGGAGGSYSGRASRSFKSAGGQHFASQTFEPAADANGDYPATTASALGNERSREYTEHSLGGSVLLGRQWTDLALGKKLDTTYGYDAQGRLHWTKSPSGVYTRTTYDALDRPIKSEVGTSIAEDGGSPDNAVVVSEVFYDSPQTATQGVGNGRVTLLRQWVDGSTSRDTKVWHDYLGRSYKVVNPLPPHQFVLHDNLGRVVERAVFSSVPTAINAPLADRGSHAVTSYSQRGAVYRTATSLDPTSGSAGYLHGDVWLDALGAAIKTRSPGGAVQKTVRDRLGRAVTSYLTDGGGDPAPGAAGGHAAADDVTGDVVLEQTTNRYIADTPLVDLVTSKMRTHADDTTTGDLSTFTSGGDETKVITTYSAAYYDAANRRTHSASYGTNTTDFRYNTAAPPTVTQGSPPTIATSGVLVGEVQYDAVSEVEVTIGPDGTKSKPFDDDAGRQIAVVENYVDATVTWNATEGRWQAGNLSTSALDEDRVTSFVYDDSGHMVKRVAHIPAASGELVQVTQYVYGTDAVVGSLPLLTSDIDSGDLLVAVRHPIESGASAGEPGDTAEYVERFGYDRTGARTEFNDQAGTTHAYTYDALGRPTQDLVTAFGTGVDQFVDRIETTYDALGRQEHVRSKSGATIRNAVKFEYAAAGAVTSVWQDPDGDVVTSGGPLSLRVRYTHASSPSTASNYFRSATLIYPDGTSLATDYGAGAGLDDRLSRSVGLKLGSTSVVAYDHAGGGTIVSTEYGVPGVMLDRSVAHDGSTSAGVYPALDQFGRLKRHLWADTDFTAHPSVGGLPNKPPIYEAAHAYDKASNRLSRVDARPGASWAERDEEYLYDGLHRLKVAKRGIWNGSSVPAVGVGSQRWTLDALGNFDKFETELTGANPYTDAGELDDRDHNAANELTAMTPADTIAYDAAGNTTLIDFDDPAAIDYTYEYDAWNRLRHIKYASVTLASAEYNGLNWRTVHRGDPGDGGLFQDREQYYDLNWRLIEERVRSDGVPDPMNPEGDPADRLLVAQHFWGARGIDDAVLKRTDTNVDGTYDSHFFYVTDPLFSAVALVDLNGALVERVRYEPYGAARHHWPHDADGDGDADSADQSAISTLAAANGGAGIAIADTGYDVEADIDRSGVINATDSALYSSLGGAIPALSSEQISDRAAEHSGGPGNPIGWSGYLSVGETMSYLVRNRSYEPRLARWLQEDPARFADGSSTYAYSRLAPVDLIDPWGLEATEPRLSSVYPRYAQVESADPTTGSLAGHYAIDGTGGWFDTLQSSISGGTVGYLGGFSLGVDVTDSSFAVSRSRSNPLSSPTASYAIWEGDLTHLTNQKGPTQKGWLWPSQLPSPIRIGCEAGQPIFLGGLTTVGNYIRTIKVPVGTDGKGLFWVNAQAREGTQLATIELEGRLAATQTRLNVQGFGLGMSLSGPSVTFRFTVSQATTLDISSLYVLVPRWKCVDPECEN